MVVRYLLDKPFVSLWLFPLHRVYIYTYMYSKKQQSLPDIIEHTSENINYHSPLCQCLLGHHL